MLLERQSVAATAHDFVLVFGGMAASGRAASCRRCHSKRSPTRCSSLQMPQSSQQRFAVILGEIDVVEKLAMR